MYALIAVEEYIDFTPWEGFRFGILQPERKGEIRRISIQGRHYDVKVSPSEIKLTEQGKEIIKTDGGAVFRRFLYSENEVYFEVKSLEERVIRVRFLTKGKYQLYIDGKMEEVFRGKSHKIKVPKDEHSVLILLLEKAQ